MPQHNKAMNREVLVRLSGVRRGYKRQGNLYPVLKGIDLELARGELVCLTGRSGAGKSTLLHIVAGLEKPDEGEVVIDGLAIDRLSESGRARVRAQKVGIVFQAFNLLDHLSVGENVMLPAAFLRGWKGNADQRASEVLEKVGLGDRFGALPGVLSGGERQRVALARALFIIPDLLICDEVTANLDVETGREVIQLIDRLRHEEQLAVLAATHDESLVRLADRQYQIKDGRLR